MYCIKYSTTDEEKKITLTITIDLHFSNLDACDQEWHKFEQNIFNKK